MEYAITIKSQYVEAIRFRRKFYDNAWELCGLRKNGKRISHS